MMIRNYLLVAVRGINRDRTFSFINVAGLAVGIACFLMLFLFIQDEFAFDRFDSPLGTQNVYRVYVKSSISGEESRNSKTPYALGPILLSDYPEVKNFMRIGYYGPRDFVHNNKVFRSGSIHAVDSSFFKFFPIEFLHGDAATALARPNSIVLTESVARTIFGDQNPVGKMLHTEQNQDFLVTGVMKDFPRQSHFRCDYLESLSTYATNENWFDLWYSTYIALEPNTDVKDFEKKLDEVVVKYAGPEAEKLLNVPVQEFLSNGNSWGFFLQPFSFVYLKSSTEFGIDLNTEWGTVSRGDITQTYTFLAIALFILSLAIVNFMNLSTAKSERRSREVGVRKTLGSDRSRLMMQFIGEAILTSALAMLVALALLGLVLPLFNTLVERDLKLMLVNSYLTAPLLIAFVIVIGILAGSYPAIFLSAAKPTEALKGSRSGRKKNLRNALVIFQFAISIALLVGTIVMKQQMRFIQSKNLGFKKEQLVSISNVGLLGDHKAAFKTELLKNSNVLQATNTTRMFTSGVPGSGYLFNKMSGTDPFLCQIVDADYDFLKTYEIDMVAGRFFSPDFPSDSTAVIVNESATRLFPADALGKYLVSLDARDHGTAYTIVGVIKDFNYESLHTQVRPLVIHLQAPRQVGNVITLRLAADRINETLTHIEKEWKKFVPNEPITYNFVDVILTKLYQSEAKANLVSGIFSGVAIFIACIGLFGLAAFITEQRTKEIGIRKVLGANMWQVLILLSKEFTILVLKSNLIAWPVAYFVMREWLSNFAFRIDLTAPAFIISGVVAFLIAFFTVSFHAIRAAESNPVKSLKYE